MLAPRLELNFERTFFIICHSPLPTALCIRLWILISMNTVFIQTINHSQNWPPCLRLMDETPTSYWINN